MFLKRFSEWWASARSSVVTHRRAKWFWIWLIPISYIYRENVAWVVFMSHYAIIASHAAAEEAAKTELKQEEANEQQTLVQ